MRAIPTILAALAIATAGVARADDTDDRFVKALQQEGIGMRATRDQLIHLGHTICHDLDNGKSAIDEMHGLYSAADISEHDAGALVGASVGAYCPQYSNEIEGH